MREWDLVPFPDLSDDVLQAICDRHGLPRRWRRRPSCGAINSIWLVDDEFVLRVPKNMDEGWKDTLTESVAAPVAHRAGILTPALVVFDDSLDLVDVPFTVYRYVPGEPGGPTTDEGWRELGRQIAALHRGVTDCDDPLGRLDDPGRWLDCDEVLEAAVREGVDGELRTRLEAELARLHPEVLAAQTHRRFLHDDLHEGNVLFTDGDLSAIIDWGDAGWGDPALELAHLPDHAVAPFIEGYRAVGPFDGDESVVERSRWDRICHVVADEDGIDAARLAELLPR